jgi:hypothetical protein
MSPFGGHHETKVPARALVLTPLPGRGTNYVIHVTLAIELPGGGVALGRPTFDDGYGDLIAVGQTIPVLVDPANPDGAELDEEHLPDASEVAAVIAEVLGGPAIPVAEPDQWRIELALAYAERVIAAGAINATQADAIRTRIRSGI